MLGGDSDKRDVEHLLAATATLRVRVDALRNAVETGAEVPREVAEATLDEVKSMAAEMKPLAAVASEFRKRWKKQRQSLVAKREAEIEYHLRQGSQAQLARMEAEAEDQMQKISQDFEARRSKTVHDLHAEHESLMTQLVEDWRKEVPGATGVRQYTINEAMSKTIETVAKWALQEEERIMKWWEEELGRMIYTVHTLDEEEMQAMEGAQYARCALMESTVERQQQELKQLRDELQNRIRGMSIQITKRAQPDEQKAAMAAKLRTTKRRGFIAKREAEIAAQAHVESAVSYLDEAAALERARVSAYHTALAQAGPNLAELLTDQLEKESEAAGQRNWNLDGTNSGLPTSMFASTSRVGRADFSSSAGGQESEDEALEASLTAELNTLRERARTMQAQVGRGDWRKEILEVADKSIEGLMQTEAALASGPLHMEKRSPRSTREALMSIEQHARDFSQSALAEFTRMRNVKVALSCMRSNHVRQAMQRYDIDSMEAEDDCLPAVSRLAHEVEVMREVCYASKHGRERMPVYIIAGAWRRALLATYAVAQRLWSASNVPDAERKDFIRELCCRLAVEPSTAPLFQAETKSLEATLPAPDWSVM